MRFRGIDNNYFTAKLPENLPAEKKTENRLRINRVNVTTSSVSAVFMRHSVYSQVCASTSTQPMYDAQG